MSGSSAALSARTLLWRDWRSGELTILLTALVLAVAVVVGISAFVSRLQSALESESLRFLAADLVVSSSREIPDAWIEQAVNGGLTTAQTLTFPSMVFAGDENMYLASVKAVSDGYPLRGVLRLSDSAFGPASEVKQVPAVGEVWLAPRLFALLDVSMSDQVTVGKRTLRVVGAIRSEPDSGSAMFGYGPRLLMNLADIPATDVIQPGSRVNWRLLLRGNIEQLDTYGEQIKPLLSQGQRLLGLADSQPSVSRTLDRARGFLLLAGSLAVVLAAAAIALAARRFGERHTDYVAIMKSLGASSERIAWLYGKSLLLLGALAIVLGSGVGWGIQSLFFQIFAQQLPESAGSSGAEPYIIGATTALVCLGAFAWPPLRRLSTVPPLRVLRRDVDAPTTQRPIDWLVGAVSIFALMWWYSGDLWLTGAVVSGLSVTVGCGFLLAKLLLSGSRTVGMRAGSVWRLALAGLQRRGNANAMQMVIFAVAIMMLLVLTMVRTSLVDQWQAQIPPGTPNHFMLNLAPEEVAAMTQFLAQRAIEREPLYPMTRGRVMAVDGEPLADGEKPSEERRQREANFTWSDTLPPENTLLAGLWWPADTSEALVSVEQSFAERLGAELGDVITIRIAAESFDAKIASIREVDWQTMRPNFFMVFPRNVLATYPSMFMTSFYLPDAQKSELNTLVRSFPTVTVIELDIVIKEIQSIVSQVGQAIGLVLWIILLAGALVLIAGVQASVDVRMRESALLRALGARQRLLLGALWIEFTVLGLCAGLLAVIGAELAAYVLQTEVLDLRYQASPRLWPVGLLMSALAIGTLGVWRCRKVTTVPPLQVLRDA